MGREGPIVQIGAALASSLGQWLRFSPQRLRTMIGCGAAGYCLGPGATDADAAVVGRLLKAIGISLQVSEPLLDVAEHAVVVGDDVPAVPRFRQGGRPLFDPGTAGRSNRPSETIWSGLPFGYPPRGALPIGPMVVFVHIASVWVPFTSESKEAVAHYPEIIKEMKLALQEAGRRLGKHVKRRARERDALKKQWDTGLVETYGLLDIAEPGKQLSAMERFLADHPDDPTLLLTLGRLSLRAQLWGKARGYGGVEGHP